MTERDHLKDVRIILKLILDRKDIKLWTGFFWFGILPIEYCSP
jgi:hypothetical protein